MCNIKAMGLPNPNWENQPRIPGETFDIAYIPVVPHKAVAEVSKIGNL